MQEKEKTLKVLVVEDNPADARLVREMLAQAEGQSFKVQCAETLVGALEALAHEEFNLALVDLGLPDSQGLATFETIQRHANGLPVVVFTGVTNEMLALTAVARGAQDYLVKNRMTSQALVRVLQYAMARQKGQTPQGEKAKARMLGVMGVKGGVGSTTLAAHVATEWARQSNETVLLVDLDVSSASTEFLLKIKSRYSILDAATNLHRLDLAFWKGVVATSPYGIDVLQSPGALAFAEQLSGERVRHVLRFARTLYGCIVVDLARLNLLSMSLLEEVGDLLVVTTPELPALYEASRNLRKLMDLGLRAEHVHLVFNRVPKSSFSPVPPLEKALGYTVSAAIPDCSAELTEAYSEGRFLDVGLSLRKQVAPLVARLQGTEIKTEERGFLRFFKLARA